jgi:sec-independent protein translocase protein TatB
MNFGFSGEMIFLFLLALILFGPKKLPEIGRQIGRIMNEFRRASYEFRSQIESEINAVDSQKRQIMPSFKEPLGSLASRILNPPSIEELRKEELKKAGYRTYEEQASPPVSDEDSSLAPPQLASEKVATETVASENVAPPTGAIEKAASPQVAPEKAVPEKVAPDA